VLLLSHYVKHSKMGYYLMAINSNQDSVASLGVNVRGYKLRAQFLTTFLMAIGGGVYAMLNMYLDPMRILGIPFSFEIVLFTIVGGRATVWGPALGALVMYPLNEMIRANFATRLPGISIFIYGITLMLIIYFLPGGLIVYFQKLNLWLNKHLANYQESISKRRVSRGGG